MAVRCVAKVADAYKKDTRTPRKFKPHGSVPYDARNLTWFPQKNCVTIWTVTTRLNADGMRIAVLNNLALSLSNAGQHEAAQRLFQDALALCLRQGDLHHVAALYNNIADVFHRRSAVKPLALAMGR